MITSLCGTRCVVAASVVALAACSFQGEQLSVPFLTGEIVAARASPVIADGVDSTRLRIVVYDSLGHHLAGYLARVEATGDVVLVQPELPTDAYGETYAHVRASSVGTATVSAAIETEPGTWLTLPSRATVEFVATLGDTLRFEPQHVTPTGAQPVDVIIADGDRDSDNDIVTADWGAGTVSLLANLGDGSFPFAVAVAATPHPRSVAILDATGDGIPDAVVADDSATSARVLSGTWDGQFSTSGDLSAPGSVRVVAANDISGDTLDDLVVASTEPDSMHVLVGASGAAPTLAGAATFPTADAPQALWLGRLSATDVWRAAMVLSHADVLVTYRIASDGIVEPELDVTLPQTCTPRAVAVLDRGETFAPTAVVACLEPPGIRLATGSIPSEIAWETLLDGEGATDVVAADLNDDGLTDIAVTIADANASGTVAVLLATTTGSFAAPVALEVGARPAAIAAGDLNADGRTDLAVANYDDATVSVLLSR